MKHLTPLLIILLLQLSIFAQSEVVNSTVADTEKVAVKDISAKQAEQNSAIKNSLPSPQKSNFCDPNYRGGNLSFTHFAELTLDDLLLQIHNRFGIGFLVGPTVGNQKINIKADNVAWNVLLNSQLFVLGVRATCIDEKTIQLVKSEAFNNLQDSAEVKTRFIKLKFLQPTSGGNVDVAGRSSGGQSGGGGGQGCQSGGQGGGQGGGGGGQSGGCGNFEKLISEIRVILGLQSAGNSGGQSSGGTGETAKNEEARRTLRSVSQVPGRNILVVKATDEELALINQIIERADRPPFQVVIKGLVYTANENRLRDIGASINITAGTADGRSTSGIFGHTLGGLGTLFDFSTLIGTVNFNAQANALQQNGVIAIKSRPFAVVLDGDTTELEVGRQIPVLTQGSNLGGAPGNLEFIGASNLLSVTPHVIDDDNGNPVAVNLQLQLESNEVDTAVVSQGVPSVNRRSIQSRLILNQEKTVILGGFTVDSLSDDVSKTPGLGDLPILGYLFKRKVKRAEINRLYFAISVEIVPYGSVIEPVVVPGATTDIPTVLPEMIKPVKAINNPVISKPQ